MTKYQPIVMPRGKKYGSNYWKSFSMKENRIITLYSDLEYKNWLTVEMNPDIDHFCEQPLEVEVEIEGKISKSIFDMWVSFKNGSEEFWEVKYLKDIHGNGPKSELTRKQIEKQTQWCKENQYTHKIRTESDIEIGVEYMNNLRHLSHLCRVLTPYKDVNPYKPELISYLRHNKKSVEDIIKAKILPEGNEMAVLAYLIYDGTIMTDLITKPFTYNTEVESRG